MMRRLAGFLFVLQLCLAGSAGAAEPVPPDYARPSAWLCRPGHEGVCVAGLHALAVAPDGERTPLPFAVATAPALDCFYVYPTVSRERARHAAAVPAAEVVETARAQAGWLASRCRLFVPLYRQVTLAGLAAGMAEGGVDWHVPYSDVRAAWRHYLAHDNHGRGVVLVGHSQGTVLLRQLIDEEIEGRPAQRLLVSAFLAGSPQGTAFPGIGPCRHAGDTGCVYVWGSFAADDAGRRLFGRAEPGGGPAVCVNPAAPAGGSGTLKPYLHRPASAGSAGQPWIVPQDTFRATCVADRQGNVLRIDGPPGWLQSGRQGWGLHKLDISLVLGNILDLLDSQALAWRAGHR